MPDRPRPRPNNIGASVRQRLLNLAHARGQPMELLLTRYALERLLHRLSLSPMQKALQRVAREQQFHGLAARIRKVQQALAHGGADVARAIRHRWSAP